MRMCGVYGLAFDKNLLASRRNPIYKGLNLLGHRGPDAKAGLEIKVANSVFVGMGHCRLAILGEGHTGAQPMTRAGRTIVFNGEIYNFKELGRELLGLEDKEMVSDTEVLLELWSLMGSSVLSRLRGIFAFALYDRNDNSLSLVRDSFGVKPMYYSFTEGNLSFASEPQAIAKSLNIKQPNPEAGVVFLLKGRYDFGPQTFFKDINSQEPGSVIQFAVSRDGITKKNEWKFAKFDLRSKDISFEAASKKMRNLFLQAVERNLVSDVPIAFALSGGLDSASIVSAVRHIKPKQDIRVFSYEPSNPEISEFHIVKQLAQDLNLEVVRCQLDRDEALGTFAEFVEAQGEPVGSSRPMAQYIVFKAAAKNGFKVVIEGQGGDEILAGYHGFAHLRLLDLVSDWKFGQAAQLLSHWGNENPSYNKSLPFILLAQQAVQDLWGMPWMEAWARSTFGDDNAFLRASSLERAAANEAEKSLNRDMVISSSATKFKKGLFIAASETYLPQLLRQGDRNAMAHSVENRVPFLDEDFVQFAWSLPDDFLLNRDGRTKSIFRHSMIGLVPQYVLDRKDKNGFSTDSGLLPPVPSTGNQDVLGVGDLPEKESGLSESAIWRKRTYQTWLQKYA